MYTKYTDGKINHWYQGLTEDLKKELHDKYVSLSICMYVYVCMYVLKYLHNSVLAVCMYV